MSICLNKKYEQEFRNMMISQGHHCERIAGSGSGQQSVCDCILFKDGETFLVEIKATREPKLYMRKGIREQLAKMIEVASKANVKAMLAIKYKYRGWNMQVLDDNPR